MKSDKFVEINQLVRKAEVSLFVGSGFSLKAEAPSASNLVHSLATRFPKGYHKGLRFQPLDDISSEYVKICHGDREPLLSFLKKKMDFRRKNLSDHRALARIPHFRHIFTTNYDTLLEDSYPASELKIVRCNADCSLSDRSVNIYKIHGDFKCPEQIVITRRDYDELLSSKKNEMVWNRVIEAFATTDILFLGYSLNDSNVRAILEHVTEILGDKRRRVFLIAPQLTDENISELASLSVAYIDAVAEEFLSSLTEALKDNVYFDFVSGNVSKDVALRFFDLYKITTVFEYSDGKLVVKSINPSDRTVQQNIHFTLKEQSDFLKDPTKFDFNSLVKRSKMLSVPCVQIDKNNIVSFERRINGVKVMGTEDLGILSFGPTTLFEGKMNVVAPRMGIIEVVPYKTYRSGEKLVLQLDTPLCDLLLIWELNENLSTNCVIQAIYKEDYGQYEKAISWTKIFMAIFGGDEVQFGESLNVHVNPAHYPGFVDKFRKSLDYYTNVYKIEVIRKMVFSRHDKYEEGAEDLSNIVLHLLAKDSYEEELNTKGKIEFVANPGISIPSLSSSGAPIEFFALRISETTENDIELNGVNFGRVTKLKDIPKGHIEKVYEKNGQTMATIVPDDDHWVVRYVEAENVI